MLIIIKKVFWLIGYYYTYRYKIVNYFSVKKEEFGYSSGRPALLRPFAPPGCIAVSDARKISLIQRLVTFYQVDSLLNCASGAASHGRDPANQPWIRGEASGFRIHMLPCRTFAFFNPFSAPAFALPFLAFRTAIIHPFASLRKKSPAF